MIPRLLGEGDDVPPPQRPPRFDQVTIGDRMRRAREAAGLSRPALCAKIGMAEDTLRKKESGENPFYFPELTRICDELDAPSLFPIMDWGEARLADKLLGRDPDQTHK
jgi:transcriptional regulator with XRE-family HTH domain